MPWTICSGTVSPHRSLWISDSSRVIKRPFSGSGDGELISAMMIKKAEKKAEEQRSNARVRRNIILMVVGVSEKRISRNALRYTLTSLQAGLAQLKSPANFARFRPAGGNGLFQTKFEKAPAKVDFFK